MTDKTISDFPTKTILEPGDLILIEAPGGEYKTITPDAIKAYVLSLNPEVILLLPMDNDFNDVVGNPLTVSGNPTISSTVFKFGNGSGNFVGTNSYIRADYIADELSTAEEWTIRGWLNLDSKAQSSLISFNTSSGGNRLFLFYYPPNSSFTEGLTLYSDNSGDNHLQPINTGQFYHFELGYKDGIVEAYIDGILKGSVSVTINDSDRFVIGMEYDGSSASDFFPGYFDGIQIIKNKKMHSQSFTPPTEPYSLEIE